MATPEAERGHAAGTRRTRVLVAYASAHGATRGVAAGIAGRLREAGLQVESHPVDQVVDLGGYDAVVIGSAVHSGRWLPDAVEFLHDANAALTGQPVWQFSVGLVGMTGSAFRPSVARRLRAGLRPDPRLAKAGAALRVRDHHFFAGAVEPVHWPLSGRLVFKAMTGHFGDFRDWAEINAWAGSIASELTAERPSVPSPDELAQGRVRRAQH